MRYTPPLNLISTTQIPKYISKTSKKKKKTSSGKLLTALYRKKIDGQFYLHRKSEHPETLK